MNNKLFSRKAYIRWGGVFVSVAVLLLLFWHIKPEGLGQHLRSFPFLLLALVFVLLVVNVCVVAYRYHRILIHFGFNLGWWSVFRANVLGNIASLVVIPLMGQMVGRQAILQEAGISSIENAAIVAYERVLVGGLSAGLAVVGGMYLLGISMNGLLNDIPLTEVAALVFGSCMLSVALGSSAFEKSIVEALFTKLNLFRVVELAVITLLSLALMLSCFVLLFSIIAPDESLLVLLSIAAVVSFAAGLPISFGGWGLREITAVYMLGSIGVGATPALAASIMCGVLSILSVLALGPFVIFDHKSPMHERSIMGRTVGDHSGVAQGARISIEHIAAWVLCFMVALFILFQVYIPIGNTAINVNLADPFAILALSVILLDIWFHRELPKWRIPYFNHALLLMAVVILLGFLHGWYTFGGSSWATGKALGWLVLCGYLAAGYLCASYFGIRGVQRLVETMAVVLCAILVWQAVARLLEYMGVPGLSGHLSYFEGYSGNRNALAFQILAVMSAFVVFFRFHRHKVLSSPILHRNGVALCGMAIMIAGMLLTASRTGIATMCVVLFTALIFRIVNRKMILVAVACGIALWAALVYVPGIYSWLFSTETLPGAAAGRAMQSSFSTDQSDSVRWVLILKAVEVWLEAPFFGNGLGYFFSVSDSLMGVPIVIHTTALWLLVEFGLVGMLPFLATFVMIISWALRHRRPRIQTGVMLLLLLSFALMSAFHEMLYQRLFWFIAGGALGCRPAWLPSYPNGLKTSHKG